MRCKRWGCEETFSERPDRPSNYRGGRYKEFCSDACRMAETRREKAMAAADLSLDEVVFFQETIAVLLGKYQKSNLLSFKYNAKIHTTVWKIALKEVEMKRKYPHWRTLS